ncbi:unnamed protein product [Mycena citricolor]|uniref:DUF6533 domain-containing protein n=1 Tax=Mycena citricolor TaxID=2018698 RepID=A0AAD2HW30_9AGAR|nr:unnamed protein product [Mycena citricolor]
MQLADQPESDIPFPMSLENAATAPMSTLNADEALAVVINYRSSLAALVWVLYDICITFDQEVALIWPKPWSRMKFLYLFIRYVPISIQLSIVIPSSPELVSTLHLTPHACYVWKMYQGLATIMTFAAVDFVLILRGDYSSHSRALPASDLVRVYALWTHSRPVHWIVAGAFALDLVAIATGFALMMRSVTFDNMCLPIAVPNPVLLGVFSGTLLIFQTVLFVLTAIRFVHAVRQGWGDSPLVELVMRDGAWAFAVLFAIIASVSGLYISRSPLAEPVFGWLLLVYAFCGYRVLLNLERLAAPRMYANRTVSEDRRMQFTTRLTSRCTADDTVSADAYRLHSI